MNHQMATILIETRLISFKPVSTLDGFEIIVSSKFGLSSVGLSSLGLSPFRLSVSFGIFSLNLNSSFSSIWFKSKLKLPSACFKIELCSAATPPLKYKLIGSWSVMPRSELWARLRPEPYPGYRFSVTIFGDSFRWQNSVDKIDVAEPWLSPVGLIPVELVELFGT